MILCLEFRELIFFSTMLLFTLKKNPFEMPIFGIIHIILISSTSEPWSNALGQDAIKKLHKTGYIHGDFTIGALFPIHGLPNSTKNSLECDDIKTSEGIQLVEAAFYAVDSINKDNSILPNITLGIEIKDECWSELVSLYQTIKLIGIPSMIGRNLEIPGEDCSRNNTAPLIGVIGTASSANIIPIQNTLELFQLPLISYSSSLLNFKTSRYFFSVTPSVYQEAWMIIQTLKKFKLTYFSIAYIDDYFGVSGRFYLQELAEFSEICVAANVHLPNPRQSNLHSAAIKKLFEDRQAKVIVCFCDSYHIISLFAAIREQNLTGNFMIIGIHDWLTHDFKVNGYEEEALGSIMVGVRRKPLSAFDTYYLEKKLHSNDRNPWFEEFWEYQFQCKIQTDRTSSSHCKGNEDLSSIYQQSSKVYYVIKSVYALAHALDKMYTEHCKTKPCSSSLKPFNSTQYLGYLKKLNFWIYREHMCFGPYRAPTAIHYDMFNFQKNNNSFRYVKICEYSSNSSNFDQDSSEYSNDWSNFVDIAAVQLPGGHALFKSSCSEPCLPGQIRRNYTLEKFAEFKGKNEMCCWSCVPCKPEEIVVDGITCTPCPTDFWPNDTRTECYKLPITYGQWTPLQFYSAKGFSILGISLTLFTTYVFLKYKDTPVVKSSTRELCYIILFGVLLHHCTIFLCVAEPSLVTCFSLRVFPTLSYTLVFGALLVKTNRIARLLAISKRRFPNLNPRFMTLKAQGVLVCILIIIQIILSSINAVFWQNYITKELDKETPAILKRCSLSAEANASCSIYNLMLMLLCCYYAFKTRNIPDNFNEAKFIGFLAYITTLICIACSLIYYGSQWKMISLGISMSANGFNVLIFLFFPKMYIILWVPERNTREYFTTATGIRCIIGRKDIITNERLLRKKFMRKDLENIEDLYSLRTSSTKDTSLEETSAKQEY